MSSQINWYDCFALFLFIYLFIFVSLCPPYPLPHLVFSPLTKTYQLFLVAQVYLKLDTELQQAKQKLEDSEKELEKEKTYHQEVVVVR